MSKENPVFNSVASQQSVSSQSEDEQQRQYDSFDFLYDSGPDFPPNSEAIVSESAGNSTGVPPGPYDHHHHHHHHHHPYYYQHDHHHHHSQHQQQPPVYLQYPSLYPGGPPSTIDLTQYGNNSIGTTAPAMLAMSNSNSVARVITETLPTRNSDDTVPKEQENSSGAVCKQQKVYKVCEVCGDTAKSLHFGGVSCDSCKAFFRRAVQNDNYLSFQCPGSENCTINISTRKSCQFCRFQKCTGIGMEKKWVMSDHDRVNLQKQRLEKKQKKASRTESLTSGSDAGENSSSTSAISTQPYEPEVSRMLDYMTQEDQSEIENLVRKFHQSYKDIPYKVPIGTPNTPRNSIEIIEMFTTILRRMVYFHKNLANFNELSPHDQSTLLRQGVLEMCMLRSALTYDFSNNRWPKTTGDMEFLKKSPILRVEDMAKLVTPDLYNMQMNFIAGIQELGADEPIVTLLILIVLFYPDRTGLENLKKVGEIQDTYLRHLKNYINWRFGPVQGAKTYPKFLTKLSDLRQLNDSHNEYNLRLAKRELNQIQEQMSKINLNPYTQWDLVQCENTEPVGHVTPEHSGVTENFSPETSHSPNEESSSSSINNNINSGAITPTASSPSTITYPSSLNTHHSTSTSTDDIRNTPQEFKVPKQKQQTPVVNPSPNQNLNLQIQLQNQISIQQKLQQQHEQQQLQLNPQNQQQLQLNPQNQQQLQLNPQNQQQLQLNPQNQQQQHPMQPTLIRSVFNQMVNQQIPRLLENPLAALSAEYELASVSKYFASCYAGRLPTVTSEAASGSAPNPIIVPGKIPLISQPTPTIYQHDHHSHSHPHYQRHLKSYTPSSTVTSSSSSSKSDSHSHIIPVPILDDNYVLTHRQQQQQKQPNYSSGGETLQHQIPAYYSTHPIGLRPSSLHNNSTATSSSVETTTASTMPHAASQYKEILESLGEFKDTSYAQQVKDSLRQTIFIEKDRSSGDASQSPLTQTHPSQTNNAISPPSSTPRTATTANYETPTRFFPCENSDRSQNYHSQHDSNYKAYNSGFIEDGCNIGQRQYYDYSTSTSVSPSTQSPTFQQTQQTQQRQQQEQQYRHSQNERPTSVIDNSSSCEYYKQYNPSLGQQQHAEIYGQQQQQPQQQLNQHQQSVIQFSNQESYFDHISSHDYDGRPNSNDKHSKVKPW